MDKRNLLFLLQVTALLFYTSVSQAQNVTLTVGNGSGYVGSSYPVEVSLDNPNDRVKSVSINIYEDTGDDLIITGCETTSRTVGFQCTVFEILGHAVVSLNDAQFDCHLIEEGTGPIFTLRYEVSSSAPSGGACRDLDPQDITILDEDSSPLSVTPVSGQFCFDDCSLNEDCEDGLYCSGTDTCSGGVCSHIGDPCPATECNNCNEADDSCFDPDGTTCTTDGLYCNGEEKCNGSGSCVSQGTPCPHPEAVCNEADDQCECDYSYQCEDGIYCNGEDFCLGGVCSHIGDPCEEPGTSTYCDEDNGKCACCIDDDCDDDNICTDDDCNVSAGGYCIYDNNTDPCDDDLFCNGYDECYCGECVHDGNPCDSPDVCYEDGDTCDEAEVEIIVMFGSGTIGSTNRAVNVQLKNPGDSVNGIVMKICDEHDYLIGNRCEVSSTLSDDFSCNANEQPDGCVTIFFTPNNNPGHMPIWPSSVWKNIFNIEFDVGLCRERDTTCTDCGGVDCYQEGVSCSAGVPDCYRFDRNKICNCNEPDCYFLEDPCLPVDTGDVALNPEDFLVLDNGANELGTLGHSGSFDVSCDQDEDCNKGSVCSIDTCVSSECVHTNSAEEFCDDGLYCTNVDRCTGGECVGGDDTCGAYEKCDEEIDQCIACPGDYECDGVPDSSDNCYNTPNGPNGGTCTRVSVGEACLDHCDCGAPNGYCSMSQEDSYPPQGNDLGDACDCEGDFLCDGDVDGSDAQLFKTNFGRSPFVNPCTDQDPCNGDFDCDVDVDGTDAQIFKADFGRSNFVNPCPACAVGDWCSY